MAEVSRSTREAARAAAGSTAEPLPGASAHPAVRVELYGSLRIRTGQADVALRADSIRTAMGVLREARPELKRLLPLVAQLPETHRFSINGHAVTTDLDTPLREGDHVVLFSASVGG